MIVALHDNIILKRNQAEEKKTPAGIVIPASGGGTDTAEVVGIGPFAKETMEDYPESKFGIGDTVVITRLAGSDVTIDREKYVIISFEDILAVQHVDAEETTDVEAE